MGTASPSGDVLGPERACLPSLSHSGQAGICFWGPVSQGVRLSGASILLPPVLTCFGFSGSADPTPL